MKKSEKNLINIFNFIKEYQKNNSFPPSYREISENVGIKSTNSIKLYVDLLEERGFIRKHGSKNRCIEILTDTDKELDKIKSLQKLPLIGRVAAGNPILAEENCEEMYYISKNLFGINDDLFMLEVVGESMIEIGIQSGDYIIAKKQKNADNGDLIVAMIDGEATVKNFYKEKNVIRLQPQNVNYSPIFCTNVDIIGKVVGLLKKF